MAKTKTQTNDDSYKVLAALSYPIFIIAIVTAAIAKDNKYVRYHGFQALFWGIGGIILYFIMTILSMILMMIPFIWMFLWLIYLLIWIGWIVASIIFAVKAYQGEQFKIPLIYDLTKSIVKDVD